MSHICSAEELDDHESNACYYPKGGISALAVLKTGHGITDFSNSNQTQTAIDAGNYKIQAPIKAELPASAPIEGENVTACGAQTIVDGFDYTITYKDFNVNAENDEHYRQLNISTFSGIVMYLCEEDAIRVVDRAVNFVSQLIIPVSNREKQYYQVTIKWSQSVQDPLPVLYDAPNGIFA